MQVTVVENEKQINLNNNTMYYNLVVIFIFKN